MSDGSPPGERTGPEGGRTEVDPWGTPPLRLKLGKAAGLATDETAGWDPGLLASAAPLGRPKSGVMCLYCRHWLRLRDTDEGRFRPLSVEDSPPWRPPKRSAEPDASGELDRDGGLEKSSYCAMVMLPYRQEEPREEDP